MPRALAGALGAIVLAAALHVGFRSVRGVPPLGPFLDPVRGVWALATRAELDENAHAAIPTLTDSVDIRYDDRGVPHIFATNELDATRALGFVVARDRLFQLELQTRASNGTLTELVGSVALETDRETRRIGLPWGARRRYRDSSVTAETRAMGQAYADGVNAYIDQMGAADLPLEYRLLNKKPQRWEPEHSVLLLMRMGHTLTFSAFELARERLKGLVGDAAVDALFPPNAYVQEPIQPNGHREARLDARRFPAPGTPGTPGTPGSRVHEREGSQASNNWAVAPSRSASGYALLANDPHLEMSLPSTWYEAHIVVPGQLDVYGAALPGAISITLGLNRDVAWGATNVGADVIDYYLETVDNAQAPTRYRLDGAWRDLQQTVETYFGARNEVLAVDTLRYTHRGPLFRDGDRWISQRWLMLEGPIDYKPFTGIARATTVAEFFEAMHEYQGPAQNFIVADRLGHIGVRSTGYYPVRPGGRGDRLFDGSTSASDWTGWITPKEAPQMTDPPQGFLASANQQPADPRAYPAYLGNEWYAPWRAMRINTLLRADSTVTADEMRRFQTDAGNARADAFTPLLLEAAGAELAAGRGDSVLARATQLLGEWDRRYTAENERAILFENAMREVVRRTWDELADSVGEDLLPVRIPTTPFEHALLALTREPASTWWDVRSTPTRETRDAILAASLRAGLVRTERERGPADGGRWRWSGIRFANIWHPLRLAALSALEIPVTGGRESLSPSSGDGTHGASWRLVAEMSPRIRAWGIYPGGQSANVVSSRYRDRIEKWQRGDLDSLRIPVAPESLSVAHHAATLTLRSARP